MKYLHDSESILARIRSDGGWDRRYRRSWRQAEPYHHSTRDHLRDVATILLTAAVLAVWLVALLWALPVLFVAVTRG